jgi:Lrp/AsnC family leucine-responsive transcriptional regulator
MNLDETDIKLLRILQEDSNLTTKELAAKVNLSPTPVFERVRRLEKEGFIKKYTAILDAEKLSRGFVVFCNTLNPQGIK